MTTRRIFAASSLALSLAALAQPAFGQHASATANQLRLQNEFSSHPIVGTWLVRTLDSGVQPSFFYPDGTFFASTMQVQVSPDGAVTYLSPQNGIWEPDPETPNGIRFRTLQSMFDATGTFTGTFTIEAFPAVSDDGSTLDDDWTRSTVTIRDANNEVLQVLGNDGSFPAIHGVRFTLGELEFPGPAVPAATPPS